MAKSFNEGIDLDTFKNQDKRSDERTCRDVLNKSRCHKGGTWFKMEGKILQGGDPVYGARKFKTLKEAQEFACDKRKFTYHITRKQKMLGR